MNAELDQRSILRKNIRAIAELEQRALHERSAADRLSDEISRATGSGRFALFHVGWFGGWFLINSGLISAIEPFDPYPFSFLTLVVSLEAIFLSVFVLTLGAVLRHSGIRHRRHVPEHHGSEQSDRSIVNP